MLVRPCHYLVVCRCEDSEDSPPLLPAVVVYLLKLSLPPGLSAGETERTALPPGVSSAHGAVPQ